MAKATRRTLPKTSTNSCTARRPGSSPTRATRSWRSVTRAISTSARPGANSMRVCRQWERSEWIEGALSAFATDTARPGMPAVKPAVAAPSNIATLYSRKNPFPATTQVNLDLSGHGSGKEVRHLELSLEGAGLNYEPGDSLGVIPANDHASVVALLHALALDPEARIDAGGEEATLEQ